MNAIASVDQRTLDAHLAATDIPAVFEILRQYPDLRHTDLPKVDKSMLQAIATNPQAIRQMALGFASLSPSIRRFCKKYFPKLGRVAATDLLYLLVESLDPLRPISRDDEGLLGSCGGYASPLGQAIQEANLDTTIRRPEIEVYSEASRFAREVLELLPSALAATDFETFLLAFEYYYGLGIFYSMTPNDYQSPLAQSSEEVLLSVFYPLTNEFKEVLRTRAQKGDTTLYEALQAWAKCDPWDNQARWQQPAIQPIRARFLHLHHPEVARMNWHWAVADYFACCPQDQRITLYRLLQEKAPQLGDRHTQLLNSCSLRYYRDRYPEEAAQADLPPPVPTPNAPAAAPAHPPASPAATSPSPNSLVSLESFAVNRDDALGSLYGVADLMKLYGVAREIFFDDLDFAAQEDFPPPSADPAVQQDEQFIQKMRQFVRMRGRRVSLKAIAATSYSEPFLDLLQRAIPILVSAYQEVGERSHLDDLDRPVHPDWASLRVMQAALTFLPDPLFQSWLELWRDRLLPFHPWLNMDFNSQDALPQLVKARFPDTAPFLLMEWQQGKDYPSCDEHWQGQLAQAYLRNDDRGRRLVRQTLASISLKPNPHYRRSDWHPAYQWLITQWWEQKDTELLAIACARCAIPMYWKGEKAYSPIVKDHHKREGYAPRTVQSSDGAIAVQDLCQWVSAHCADMLPSIVRHNLQLAGDERAACTLLMYFARVATDLTPFQTHSTALLELLESPHPYAIAAGLDIFTTRPELAETVLPDVQLAADRALASSSTGLAKQAIACLGQLAIAYPDNREQVLSSLENALYSETKSVLEDTLKTWKKVLSAVKTLAFPETAVARVQELAERDPKHYSKLVQPLLTRQG